MVIDASVAVKWFLEEDRVEAAAALRRSEHDLWAPGFIQLEVAHSLWVAVRQGRTTAQAGQLADRVLPNVVRRLVPDSELLAEAARLMRSLAHPIYDCLYLALAFRENLTLVTADERQFELARRSRIRTALL